MDSLKHFKTVQVKNPKNLIVQMPRIVTELWGIKEGDSVDVLLDETTGAIIIKPKTGYITLKKVEN